jgi:hypothetical protein
MKANRPGTAPLLLALSLVGVCSTALIGGDEDDPSRRSLQGIGSLHVVVEQLPEGARQLGLSEESLRTDVELKLRRNGITVTDVKGSQALLYVAVNVVPGGGAASLYVAVEQPARLLCDDSIYVTATTWSTAGAVANPEAKFIRDRVGDLMDQFLNAWLAVNPKAR